MKQRGQTLNYAISCHIYVTTDGKIDYGIIVGMGSNLNDETVKEWPEQALRFMMRHGWISEK